MQLASTEAELSFSSPWETLQTGRSCCYTRSSCYHPEGLPGWRNGLIVNLWSSTGGTCKVLHLRRNNSMHQEMPGADWLGSSFAEKDEGVLVDTRLDMSQQCALPAKVAKRTLGHVRQSVTSRPRKVTPALVRHIWSTGHWTWPSPEVLSLLSLPPGLGRLFFNYRIIPHDQECVGMGQWLTGSECQTLLAGVIWVWCLHLCSVHRKGKL